jgi:transposase
VPKIALTREELARLTRTSRAPSTPQRLARRSAIVLMAADGVGVAAIADRIGVSPPTVRLWIGRFIEHGIDGIMRDATGRGRPRTVDGAALASAIEAASVSGSARSGSIRGLARDLGVSASSVWRALKTAPQPVAAARKTTPHSKRQ